MVLLEETLKRIIEKPYCSKMIYCTEIHSLKFKRKKINNLTD